MATVASGNKVIKFGKKVDDILFIDFAHTGSNAIDGTFFSQTAVAQFSAQANAFTFSFDGQFGRQTVSFPVVDAQTLDDVIDAFGADSVTPLGHDSFDFSFNGDSFFFQFFDGQLFVD